MTAEEKAAAFDLLAVALTNRWHDGLWSWWCPTACGGLTKRETQDEAIQDLVEWAAWTAKANTKRIAAMRVHVSVGLPMSGQPDNSGQLHGQGHVAPDDPGGTPVGSGGDVRGQGYIPGSPYGGAQA